MKAAVYHEYGAPEVLQLKQVEKPTPKDDEVLIRIHATSVTTGDVNVRGFVFVPPGFGLLARLMFGLKKPKKPILGIELAGEIEAVGRNVQSFKKGDPVYGIDSTGMGAYAEYKCMPEKGALTHKPANLSYEEAAAIPNGATTALFFLRDKARVQPGQTVLVIGASGSTGSAAVQLAKYFGAEVTGVCSTRNLDLVRSLGADKVIDYTQEDFTRNGQTYDFIFDTVCGKTSFARCKGSLKANGLYLAVAGGVRELLQALLPSAGGGKKVIAGMLTERKEDLLFLKTLVEQGQLKPVIDCCYPLEQIVEAHRYVDTGRKKGNVVITVRTA
jgi:NADPH:quinone reductase-like Zn-dependent oxidoreductase